MTGSNLNLKVNSNIETGKNNSAAGWQEKLGLVFPNPGTLIFLLTAVVLILSVFITGKPFAENIKAWGKGFIGLYPFCMEIILLFLTGYALAVTPLFKRMIRPLAEAPQSSAQAAIYLSVFSIIFSWFNWGLGTVCGVLLARETAKKLNLKGKMVSYPLLITSGCAGLVVWETGLSGVIPLYLAEKGHFLDQTFGLLPIGHTVLSPANIITSLVLLIAIPLTCYLLHPKEGQTLTEEQLGAEGLEIPHNEKLQPKVLAERLERSTVLNLITGLIALLSMIMVFTSGGNLNLKNYLFIGLILKHGDVYPVSSLVFRTL
ncbi:MAG: TIGR00366 family protein [Bacillota bacterium]